MITVTIPMTTTPLTIALALGLAAVLAGLARRAASLRPQPVRVRRR